MHWYRHLVPHMKGRDHIRVILYVFKDFNKTIIEIGKISMQTRLKADWPRSLTQVVWACGASNEIVVKCEGVRVSTLDGIDTRLILTSNVHTCVYYAMVTCAKLGIWALFSYLCVSVLVKKRR